jgi:hypothetical protein
MLKLTISEFLKRLTTNIWRSSHELLLQLIYYYLAATFIAVLIADLAECNPVTHYWQVVPDPGPQCRQAFVQLITMAVANVTTDLLLIVFPIPIIISSQMSLKRKVQLTTLFCLSFIPVGITLYRVPNIIASAGSQQNRSLWASIEILFATAVANALVLGSFVRDRGPKKSKYKAGSITASLDRHRERDFSRRGTDVALKHWGSDEDLVRGLGIGVARSLRRENTLDRAPRRAPVAMVNGATRGGVGRGWRFPSGADAESEEETDSILKFQSATGVSAPDISSPRKMSFFDVGNLLEAEPPLPVRARDSQASQVPLIAGQRSMSPASAAEGEGAGAGQGNRNANAGNYPFAGFSYGGYGHLGNSVNVTALPRTGTSALLQDVGGLLTPPPPPPLPNKEKLAPQPQHHHGPVDALLHWGRRGDGDGDVEMHRLGSSGGIKSKGVGWALGAKDREERGRKAGAASPVLPIQLARNQREGGEEGMDLNDVGGLLR